MPLFSLLLALGVVFIWGVNYLFIQFGLQDFPPLLLASVRFFLTSLPIFFLKRPPIPLKLLLGYSLVMFIGKFSLLFTAMDLGASVGLSSLIVQLHVFFSALFAFFLLKEKMDRAKFVGAGIAFVGMGIVAVNLGGSMTLLPFFLLIGSAISFALGNVLCKKMGKVNTISLLCWGSLFAWPPLLGLSLCIEGFEKAILCFKHVSPLSVISLLYIVLFSTFVGFGLWSYLLQKYPITLVAPFTLLVPVFGMLSSVLWLHESLDVWKIEAALCVFGGLLVHFFARTKGQLVSEHQK